MRSLSRLIPVLVVVALPAAPARAQSGGDSPPAETTPQPPAPALEVTKPVNKRHVREGAAGRMMLNGTWYFRQDDTFVGDDGGWHAQSSLAGWSKIRVPHNWNATDTTLNRSSVGWYRNEFKLPRDPKGTRRLWKVRFESVNHRATVWLNGRKLGVHAPGYFPFELDLKGLRKGRNRLVVKVSSLRGDTDLTHWRVARYNGFGSGGWWNFGGISREVYVRPVDTVDVEDVWVTPILRRVGGDALVRVKLRLRNVTRKRVRVRLALALKGAKGSASRIPLGTRVLQAGERRSAATRFRIRRPRLWQPGRPHLYRLTATAATQEVPRGARRRQRMRTWKRRGSYSLAFGVKKVQRARNGKLLLNGRRLNLRGASIHEDDPRTGAALGRGQRALLVRRLRQLGASVARAHYPLHPWFLEAFDRHGILYWSQAPVYQVPASNMAQPNVLRNATNVNQRVVERDKNHASVFAWSIANELPDEHTRSQRRFIDRATRAVRALDRTRLVAIDRQSQLDQPDPVPEIAKLDAIGVNEYFGWYTASLRRDPATGGYVPSQTSDLAPFLDRTHQLYPRQALVVTEFGAEANRNGPSTEKGTFAFQSRWMTDHLRVHARRPFVSGSIAWILKDFRVHPNWGGGNPKPNPPWNNKGLIEEHGGLKPAFLEMQRQWRRARPLR